MPALRLLLSMEGGWIWEGISWHNIYIIYYGVVHQLYWREVKIRLTFKKGNVNSRLSGEMGSNKKTEK